MPARNLPGAYYRRPIQCTRTMALVGVVASDPPATIKNWQYITYRLGELIDQNLNAFYTGRQRYIIAN
jgi:hypothetical protein